MPKTVRALALAALFVLGGATVAQASTGPGSAGPAGAAGATRTVAALAGTPCMAC